MISQFYLRRQFMPRNMSKFKNCCITIHCNDRTRIPHDVNEGNNWWDERMMEYMIVGKEMGGGWGDKTPSDLCAVERKNVFQ